VTLPADLPATRVEHAADVPAFDIVQPLRGTLGGTPDRACAQRLVDAQSGSVREDEGPFDHVLEFPDVGFATSWFGKNHNTPGFQYSVAGPYDQWPPGMGFEYFYGFMGGETDQWEPCLFRDHTQIFPWFGKPGYNLTTDMADEAIQHVKQLNAAAPDKPFFVYYVPGGKMPGIPLGNAPSILNKSYTITAEVEVPQGGGNGMIVTAGGRWGGYGLYLLNGRPVFNYNGLMLAQFRWEGQQPLAAGRHTIVFDFTYDGPGIAKGGTGVLRWTGRTSPH
jgi:hypothetical protein